MYIHATIFLLLFSPWVMSNSCYHVDCSLPGASVCGIFQARILEWVAIFFSGDLSDPGITLESPALVGSLLLSHQEISNRIFSSVQLLSYVRIFATPWIAAHQASLSFTISLSLLKLMSIELVMPSNHLILCCPLLLPSIFPTIRVFCNESVLPIRWPKFQL